MWNLKTNDILSHCERKKLNQQLYHQGDHSAREQLSGCLAEARNRYAGNRSFGVNTFIQMLCIKIFTQMLCINMFIQMLCIKIFTQMLYKCVWQKQGIVMQGTDHLACYAPNTRVNTNVMHQYVVQSCQ